MPLMPFTMPGPLGGVQAQPPPATFTLTGFIPFLGIQPPPAVFILTGSAPVLNLTLRPAAATFVVTGLIPTVRPGSKLLPTGCTFVLSSSTPWVSPGLTLPTTVTVLMLDGMDFHASNYIKSVFQSKFITAPYTSQVQVDYPRNSSATSIAIGVTNLNGAIRGIGGVKIVVGYSQGAEVCSRWMETYGADGTAPSEANLMFVLCGNPRSSIGGYGVGRQTWDGSLATVTPTTSRWRVIDYKIRYDGWADSPVDEGNSLAMQNATSGKFGQHGRYHLQTFNNPVNTVWVSGNTTYVLTQEIPPMVQNWYPAEVRSQIKYRIETAYIRPSNDPPVVRLPVTNGFWRFVLQSMGIAPWP